MDVRPMQAGEGARLRALRLAALRESPEAFCATLARDEARPMRHWEDLARGPGAVLVAGDWAGIAGILLDGGQPAIWGMWVAPEHLRGGTGRRLVEAAAGWARVRGFEQLALSVLDSAPAAPALYAALGFVPTGERRARESGATEIGMRLALHPAARRLRARAPEARHAPRGPPRRERARQGRVAERAGLRAARGRVARG